MKKTYIIPETLVVKLSMCNIIAASPLNVKNDGDTATTKDGFADDGADGLAKGSTNVWDEEW